jgi:NAD(P)-dependent dehydrogenase (short-subunit alcohol dehydrogenase family)
MSPDAAPIILITGATRGIGMAAASQLSQRGARVTIASRDLNRAKAAAAQLPGASALQLDITHPDSIQKACQQLQDGRLDVLVNNSAILLDHYESLLELKPSILRQTLETNVIGTLNVTLAMLPLLEKAAAPRIINVSSGAGQLDGVAQGWAPAYSISKTALNSLTLQMSAAMPHIMVNCMCPGWCRTEMGGQEAPRSAEEGADTLVWLALEAPHNLRGKFIKDRQEIVW